MNIDLVFFEQLVAEVRARLHTLPWTKEYHLLTQEVETTERGDYRLVLSQNREDRSVRSVYLVVGPKQLNYYEYDTRADSSEDSRDGYFMGRYDDVPCDFARFDFEALWHNLTHHLGLAAPARMPQPLLRKAA